MQSAAIFGDRDPRAVDLAGPGLMTQLRDKFVDLREAGGADRMPFDPSPPDGLTGTRPPMAVSPRSLMAPPSPKAHRPRFSIWMISPMAVASCDFGN